MENDQHLAIMFYKCRGCLEQKDRMKFVSEDELEGKQLISMFISINNFEWITSQKVASYLCNECESKLDISYKFQKKCLESHEIIIKQLVTDEYDLENENSNKLLIESEDNDSYLISGEDTNQLHSDHQFAVSTEQNTNKVHSFEQYGGSGEQNDLYSVKQCIDSGEEFTNEVHKTKRNQTRIQEFSAEEVEDVIIRYKDKQKKSTYKCIICPYILGTIQALSTHMSQAHKDVKDSWCCHCNEIFDPLPDHLQLHNSLVELCPFCNNEVKKKYFIGHLKLHSDVKPYHCQHCPRGFLSKSTLDIHHSLIHSNDQRAQDGENVSDNQNEDDKSVVKGDRNYCVKCDKKVRSLPIHMNKVHSQCGEQSPQKYVCYVCTRELKSDGGLKAHLKLHNEDSPFKCKYCDKAHKSKSQMVDHERTHTGEKPHVCSVCGKGFAQSGALGTHMKMHTGRPEECNICKKRFCRPSELKLHLRKHSGEKPFLCTECGKTFIQKSHLMEHMKTHSDLRPHKCDFCDKAFKQKSLLNSHLQIHSGHKPYQCKLCEYACFKSYRLQQHMKLHEEDAKRVKAYPCPICPKGFTTQTMYNTHMAACHNAILNE